MDKSIMYKDVFYYLSFILESINPKLFKLFNIDSGDSIYRLGFILKDNDVCNSIDIYINSKEKKLLMGTILNILNGVSNSEELSFSNKITNENKGYYKLSRFVSMDLTDIMNMNIEFKLKIYRDKNFVIIEPKVCYSYLSIKINELNAKIFPVLLSKNTIEDIKLKL